MIEILDKIKALKDCAYKKFSSSLIPTVDPETVIGVRVPALRKLAKELWKENCKKVPEGMVAQFLSELPHQYYEENLLHGFLLEFIKDFEAAVKAEDAFVPFIDNWAVCDTTHPKIFKKHTEELLPWIKKWIDSGRTYSIRYGIDILMSFYLDENFDVKFNDIVSTIQSSEYYVNMMRAWYFATALAKQWDLTVYYIEDNKMDVWTHNKTIQKACESFRVSDEHKKYLRGLKR